MNKRNKIVGVLSSAAILALGGAMTAMAAQGWQMQGQNWVYYESNGDKAYDEWKKSGNNWFYLDYDGVMLTNSLVENSNGTLSYVNEAGARVSNEWHQLDWDGEYRWFWFGNNGETEDEGWENVKTADGKTLRYHFTDNKMDYGWYTDSNDKEYYLGEENEGWAKTGWQYIYEDDEASKEEGWYWFDSNGKMVKGQEKKIEGQYYSFDDNGRMMDNWVTYNVATSSTVDKFYTASDGDRADGWQYLEDMDAEDGGADTEAGYYYFKSGRAYGRDGYKVTDIGNGYGLANISGKTYCFDENGRMQTGTIEAGDGKIFYFGDENDGVMKTGRVRITYSDDYEDEYMYFAKSGKLGVKGASVTGVEGGYLYDNGLQVEGDDTYTVVELNGLTYLIRENGRVVTSGTVRDRDAGIEYTVKKNTNGGYDITTKAID